jgi:CubicO group peptidase (beta-lactamase class C family)
MQTGPLVRRIVSAAAALMYAAVPAHAQKSTAKPVLSGFDQYIAKAMQDWKVPALAIAVVKNDSIVLMKGYGTRTMGKNEPVDEHTTFAIGSASKAFTSTLVSMLVSEGKMHWDDPATMYLPGFQMYDAYVTRELTVRDLLTHRSGLSRGDVMWYATDYNRDEILRRVRFEKPTWSLRSHFGYQNIMYLAAGQAASRAAGMSWDDLVRQRIFTPLGMTETNTSVRDLAGKTNVATPHTEVDDTLLIVPWHNIDNIGPAGSINSTASDMIKWVRFQLAQGKVGGKSLVSASALGETHTAQMTIPVGADARQMNPYTHLEAYGMGWFLQDYRGRELDQHGGNIDGMSAMVALMPEEKIGMVILTNANGSPMPTIALYRMLDALLNEPPRDWSAAAKGQYDKLRAQAKEAEQKQLAQRVLNTKPSLPLDRYAGVYSDSMYGDVTVKDENGVLRVKYGTTFDGTLEHWHFDTFRANWPSKAIGKNFVTFALGADAKVQSLDFEGIGTFNRKPDAPDTTRKVVLAATDAGKLTGTFVSEAPALSIDVSYDGELKLTVPGQPPYTLLADSPTRFRLTGSGIPAGFYLEYEMANGGVKTVKLVQPEPRPTLTFAPKH